MVKDYIILIKHILECIEKIQEYTGLITENEFYNSTQAQDAVIRRIEIIGEAAKNIAPDIKSKYPDIPWKQISGIRDMLIHEYFGVDLQLTWKVAREDIVELKKKIQEIVK